MIQVLRVVIVVLAVVVTAGSVASGHHTPVVGVHGAAPAPQHHSPCESACTQVANCGVADYGGCVGQCRNIGKESHHHGIEELNAIAQSDCHHIAGLANDIIPHHDAHH